MLPGVPGEILRATCKKRGKHESGEDLARRIRKAFAGGAPPVPVVQRAGGMDGRRHDRPQATAPGAPLGDRRAGPDPRDTVAGDRRRGASDAANQATPTCVDHASSSTRTCGSLGSVGGPASRDSAGGGKQPPDARGESGDCRGGWGGADSPKARRPLLARYAGLIPMPKPLSLSELVVAPSSSE